jgi:hypothetical protein
MHSFTATEANKQIIELSRMSKRGGRWCVTRKRRGKIKIMDQKAIPMRQGPFNTKLVHS